MTKERFWVVGGDYTCMGFQSLRDGRLHHRGPVRRPRPAGRVEKLSEENRSKATARYTIASEQMQA